MQLLRDNLVSFFWAYSFLWLPTNKIQTLWTSSDAEAAPAASNAPADAAPPAEEKAAEPAAAEEPKAAE